jgi:hypothetical protein
MMHLTHDPKNPEKVAIVFSGRLNVQYIEKIYAEAMAIPSDIQQIDLSLDEVEDIDLSFLQFLFFFENKLTKQNVRITKQVKVNNLTKEIIANSGLEYILQ